MMSEEQIFHSLAKICGSKYISHDPNVLENYSTDLSFVKGKKPCYVVWPKKTKHIEEILKLANSVGFTVIPVSSRSSLRYHGDTLPQKDNSIIVDLSRMDRILSIDRKNRVLMVEPGVIFSQLIPALQKKGLKLSLPLHPRDGKSVLTVALERVPTTIPRYQWDSSDPLLCTEVVFGTGDLFRTGTAAGPGTIKQQKKSGQAQVNPMGPTQFSPFRLLQGAQGSFGIVTWATLKLELLPTNQKVFHIQSEDLQSLLTLQHELLKYRLGDELLILNNLNLANLIKELPSEIETLSNSLSKWNFIYVLSGRGKLAQEKITYQEADIDDIIQTLSLDNSERESVVSPNSILNVLNYSTSTPWRTRLRGSFQDVFFISSMERISEFVSVVEKEISEDIGIYIQALNQGTSYHCEFDIFYDQNNENRKRIIQEKFHSISTSLMDEGAFFNRPYGLWAPEVFNRHQVSTKITLEKIKKIFDPNNILNPGVLCFDT